MGSFFTPTKHIGPPKLDGATYRRLLYKSNVIVRNPSGRVVNVRSVYIFAKKFANEEIKCSRKNSDKVNFSGVYFYLNALNTEEGYKKAYIRYVECTVNIFSG